MASFDLPKMTKPCFSLGNIVILKINTRPERFDKHTGYQCLAEIIPGSLLS